MKYAAIIQYCSDQQKIGLVRPRHRQYLAQLKAEGHLAASGPFLDDSGALIIYEAESEAQARELLENDPFHHEGVFVSWQLRPWNPVLANRSLFPE
jgi:uncharacterized protein YciI